MRILKHAILGLLNIRPMSGYDITSEFKQKDIGNFWNAKHSQIYPELKKLVNEGLISYTVEIQGEKREKKLYSVLEAGREELHQWLMQLPEEFTPVKDEFMLKTYFISLLDKEEASKLIEANLSIHRLRLMYLEENYTKRSEAFNNISFESESFGNYLTLSKAIIREKGYIEWLELAFSYVR